jgi:class 3 adenylate cyclase
MTRNGKPFRMKVAGDPVRAGLEAMERHAWREALELLSEADEAGDLAPQELESLAWAAWWSGRIDECIAARERAYAGYLALGNRRRGAMVALYLAKEYGQKLAASIAGGWLGRAERLLAEEPESVEHGYLARMRTVIALEQKGDLDAALEQAALAVEIGTRFGDRDLQAMALLDKGRVLVQKGEVSEGQALLDEAMVAAVSGELQPFATGIVYCNMITVCGRLADYRRAGEWTEAAKRWCERQSINGFPGVCRVHRAEIMRLRGAWAEAEQEARQACTELREYGLLAIAGEGFYELGEIRLRMGDFRGAEEAFTQAHGMGREPQPGLALLRLAQGNVEAAGIALRRTLADESLDRLARARILPVGVEVAVAAGDVEAARSAADELESIASVFGSTALEAMAVSARGAIRLAEGDGAAATKSLRRGLQLWQEIDAPYEAARTRTLLGQAYRLQADEDAAVLELRAAASAFQRLGAVPDARRTGELLGVDAEAEAQAGRRSVRTFMFTDIVKSTELVEAIGDEAWEDVIRWHDGALRSLFAEHKGEEVDHAGDGFFVAFEDAGRAVECAVAIQRRLAEHRRTHGFSPQVRIGLHAASATQTAHTYRGKGVHAAARVAALAGGGEILASRGTIEAASSSFATIGSRKAELKGVTEPIELLSVEWR